MYSFIWCNNYGKNFEVFLPVHLQGSVNTIDDVINNLKDSVVDIDDIKYITFDDTFYYVNMSLLSYSELMSTARINNSIKEMIAGDDSDSMYLFNDAFTLYYGPLANLKIKHNGKKVVFVSAS